MCNLPPRSSPIVDAPSSPDDASSLSSSSNPFVAVAIYDPIPSRDRFGELMVENLRRAGIAAGGGDRRGGVDDVGMTRSSSRPLSLETTRTLSDQLSRLVDVDFSGFGSFFDVAAGCDMMDAYDHGIVSSDDRKRAARCEMLDELEEFALLMRHYCFVVGVRSAAGGGDGDDGGKGGLREGQSNGSVEYRLCSVGKDSPIGFREGRSTVANRPRSSSSPTSEPPGM